jgi:hypothetical protein
VIAAMPASLPLSSYESSMSWVSGILRSKSRFALANRRVDNTFHHDREGEVAAAAYALALLRRDLFIWGTCH